MTNAIHDSTRPELDSIFEQRETLSSIRLRGGEDYDAPASFVLPHPERDAQESAAA